MALCQHVYRRGGIYWWRRRSALATREQNRYLHLSLRVRDPARARTLGRLVSVEADRIANLDRHEMLTPIQEQAALKRFIDEQITATDGSAAQFLALPPGAGASSIKERVELKAKVDRAFAAAQSAFASDGTAARLPWPDVSGNLTAAEREEAQLASSVTRHFAPHFSKMGPGEEYIKAVLAEIGASPDDFTVEHARRLWLRANGEVMKHTERRYAGHADNVFGLYEEVLRERGELPSILNHEAARLVPFPPDTGSFGSAFSGQARPASSHPPASLKAVFEKLAGSKAKSGEWDTKTATQHHRLVELLVKSAGSDDPAILKQSHIVEFRSLLDKLPKNHGKSSRDAILPLAEILKKAAKLAPTAVGMSPGTVNRYLTQLTTILKYLKLSGYPVIDDGVIAALRPKDRQPVKLKRLAYSLDEAKRLLCSPDRTGCAEPAKRLEPGPFIIHDSQYWGPLIGYYTMLRLMEFCGLLLDDIVTDAPMPFIQIRDNAIRRVKTEEASERNIPVPSELVRLGFLDYVARLRQGDHKLLFPDLLFRGNKTDFGSLYNKQWSKRLDAILPEARSQKKTTHSFRKGGNSMMRKRGIDVSIRHEILGHAQQGTNAEHYLEDTDMSGKSEALSAITIVTGQLQPAPIALSKQITTPAQEEKYVADCRSRKQNGMAS